LPATSVGQLRHNLDYQRTAMEADDHHGFSQLDGAFHDLLIDALVRAIRGEEVASLIDSGAALVTKDNMAEFQ
jgi:DNA-binding GntR family transcriptional regulator